MAGHNLGIDIEVEPWMYEYLTRVLGPSPWKATNKHYEGKLLFANLQGKMGIEFMRYRKLDKKNNPIIYRVEIPWRYGHNYGKYVLSEEGVELFVEYYYKKFKNDLILWVESRIKLKHVQRGRGTIYIKDAIYDFCKKYGITEDIMPYDTLKKRVYRHFHDKKTHVTVAVD